jgi:hypothetical protein
MTQQRTKLGDTVTTTFTRSDTAAFGYIENVTLEWTGKETIFELSARNVEKTYPKH